MIVERSSTPSPPEWALDFTLDDINLDDGFFCMPEIAHAQPLVSLEKSSVTGIPATCQRHPFLTAHIQNLLMKCLSRTAGIGFRLNSFTRARTWVSRDVLLLWKSIYPGLHNLPVVSHESNDTLLPLCRHTNSRICCD